MGLALIVDIGLAPFFKSGRATLAAGRSRYETFVRRLDEALSEDARASGLDPLGAPDRTRESARAATTAVRDSNAAACSDSRPKLRTPARRKL